MLLLLQLPGEQQPQERDRHQPEGPPRSKICPQGTEPCPLREDAATPCPAALPRLRDRSCLAAPAHTAPYAAGVGTILNPVCPLKAAQPVPVTEPQSCHQHCCACTEPGTCTELGEDTGAQQFPKGMFCPKLVPGTCTELSEGTETQHFSKGMFFPKVRLESCCSSPSY